MILTNNITALGALLILLTITAATGQDLADSQPGSGGAPGSDSNQPPVADPDTGNPKPDDATKPDDGKPKANPLQALYDKCEIGGAVCLGNKLTSTSTVAGPAVRNDKECIKDRNCDTLVTGELAEDKRTKGTIKYMIAKNDATVTSVVFFFTKDTALAVDDTGLPPGHVGVLLTEGPKENSKMIFRDKAKARYFEDATEPPEAINGEPFKLMTWVAKKDGFSQMAFSSTNELKFTNGYDLNLRKDKFYGVLAIQPVNKPGYAIARTASSFILGDSGIDTGTGGGGKGDPKTPETTTQEPKATTAAPSGMSAIITFFIVGGIIIGLFALGGLVWYFCGQGAGEKSNGDVEQARLSKPEMVATQVNIVTPEDSAAVEDKEVQQEMLKEEKMEATGVTEAAGAEAPMAADATSS